METVEQSLKAEFIRTYRQMVGAKIAVEDVVRDAHIVDNRLVAAGFVDPQRLQDAYYQAHEGFVAAATDYARFLRLEAEKRPQKAVFLCDEEEMPGLIFSFVDAITPFPGDFKIRRDMARPRIVELIAPKIEVRAEPLTLLVLDAVGRLATEISVADLQKGDGSWWLGLGSEYLQALPPAVE